MSASRTLLRKQHRAMPAAGDAPDGGTQVAERLAPGAPYRNVRQLGVRNGLELSYHATKGSRAVRVDHFVQV